MKIVSSVLIFALLVGCKQAPHTLFQLQESTGITFTNNVHNTKDFNIFSYRNFYNGGGVAIGDVNNDGLADVFFTANMGSNELYLNKGAWAFEKVTEAAGFKNKSKWGTGVVMVDINSDGWLDIYICNAGYQSGVSNENDLYINNRNGTFTESAAQYGLAESGYTTHAAFFDYDLDGDLDCYILKNSFIPVNTLNYANKRDLRAADWPVADFLKGGGDKLLRNDNGRFTDISKEANIYGSLIGFGLGVTVGDVNGDHYPDIYVSNDFFERDYLYINQKNGTYKEELEQRMQHTSLASMGADMGDINNDGYTDIFTTDMLPDDDYRLKTTSTFDNIDMYRVKEKGGFYHQYMQNTMQLNNRNGTFSDIAFYSGVAASDWSWGGLMFDADGDGWQDLYVCNGIFHDVTNQDFIDFFANDVIRKMVMTGEKEEIDQVINKMPSYPIPNKAFRNEGNLKFSDAGQAWGFEKPSFSNGAAYGDLDNDGDLDLVVNNVNQKAFVYKNNGRETTKNNFIGLSLRGKSGNTFAIGSIIKAYQDSAVLTRDVMPSRGFQSSVDYKVLFGLGTTNTVDSMIVVWPDGSVTRLIKPEINKVHSLRQQDARPLAIPTPVPAAPLFDSIPLQPATAWGFEKHREDDYIDFYNERGVPMMLSREGPKAAQGDVNGDGLADLYIGGGANQAGQLYLQTANGFKKKMQAAFAANTGIEETAVLLFDCDSDGDLDLFSGAGGNHHAAASFQMQNRLYKNDGRGTFTLASGAVPPSGMNTSVAVANDFDGDGDADLFVGSRSVPQAYGASPPSFILVNDGSGQFASMDISKSSMADLGLVTGAVWVNLLGDAKKELIVVGEWMAPRIFSFSNNNFTEVKTTLNNLSGWWQSIAASDLDGDGDADLVLGNTGENFYLQPNSTAPVKLWLADYDNNGTAEKIITRTVKGKDVPVFMKRDLIDQIASLRKQNLTHNVFANKSMAELFEKPILEKTAVRTANYAGSIIAFNEGGGTFTIQKLPPQAQFSSVNALLCTDVNGDGTVDIIAGGNNFGFQPQFARLDAGYGTVMLNRGNRNFSCLLSVASGVAVRGQIRDIVPLQVTNKNYLLFLQNDSRPVLYALRKNNPNFFKTP